MNDDTDEDEWRGSQGHSQNKTNKNWTICGDDGESLYKKGFLWLSSLRIMECNEMVERSPRAKSILQYK